MKFLQKKSVLLIILLILFLAPGFVAVWVYQHPHFLAKATINKGQLLPQPSFHARQLVGNWSLILWQPQACDEACYQKLNQLHRVRLALGRQYYATDLWLMSSTQIDEQQIKKQLLDIPLRTLTIPAKKQLSHFSQQPMVFLSNPQGYFILAYSSKEGSQAVYQDLKHLLKINEKLVPPQIKG